MTRLSLVFVLAFTAGCSSTLGGESTSCESDAECSDGDSCVRGECTAASSGDVRTCSQDTECNINDGEVCTGGVCIARVVVDAQSCDTTAQCPIDMLCDPQDFVCVTLPNGWCREANQCAEAMPICATSSPAAPGRCVECITRDDCGGTECLHPGVCAADVDDGTRPIDEEPVIVNPCGANATETAPGVCVCDMGFVSDGAGHCVAQGFIPEPDPNTGGGGTTCPQNAHETSAGQCVCDTGYVLSGDFTSCVATGGGGGGGGGTPPVTSAPASWTCPDDYYGDELCDCGCGTLDIDCASLSSTCDYDNCIDGEAVPTNNATCSVAGGGGGGGGTPTIPASWTCAPAFFTDGYCDCGCGAFDTACGSATGVDQCDFDACTGTAVPSSTNNATCVAPGGTPAPTVPTAWTCNASYYSDDDCDCGCGVLDPVCGTVTGDAQCDYDGCATGLVPSTTNNATCVSESTGTPAGPPAAWTCNVNWFDDGNCDCGCGAADIDCSTTVGTGVCDFEECPTGQLTNPANNGLCVSETAPAAWDCNDEWYNDGECDCGCGTVDVDCASPALEVCDWDLCPTGSTPAATNNAICQ